MEVERGEEDQPEKRRVETGSKDENSQLGN